MQPSGENPPGLRPSGGNGGGTGSAARRIIPVAIVVVLVAGVVVAVVASSGGDEEGSSDEASTEVSADGVYLDPAVPYSVAEADGTAADIDWGARCDTELGRLALPLFPQQQCFEPWTGDDNLGSTATGVTADTIKVVVYLTQDDDPVLSFIYDQIGADDTADQVWATYQAYSAMFSNYYETYGRKVELVRFDATGNVSDSVAATADAETIANDIQPFLVVNGPLLTNAFADTLARNEIMCVSCTPGQPSDWYAERAPYVWSIAITTDQRLQMVAEYIGKRLAGRPAVNAGDEALAAEDRVFGLVYLDSSDEAGTLRDDFRAQLADRYDVEFANVEAYASPTDLSGTGRDLITRMKEAGVTTIVFDGDPLAPQTLTRIATQQEYFPEWIITGSVLTDTAGFGRTYDQGQWAHAFGPSTLFARVRPDEAGSLYLYEWYYGEPPPAAEQAPLILPNLQFLYNPLQGVGTDLTPDNFQRVLFGAPIIPSTPVTPQISFGERGVWPEVDLAALDDMTEVWWDPTATGVDELNRQGTGLWRFVDGGRRYLPGEWPETEPQVFTDDGTVTIYDRPPPEAAIPTDYEPVR